MGILANKIDFAVIVTVNHANPNGDPLNGNRPRENYDGFGEISDVCIKRKIRNRLMDFGHPVFVQPDERRMDGFKSLSDRAKANPTIAKADRDKDKEAFAAAACAAWMDVRAFGQVFAFKGDELSVGVRGPVSVHPAFSLAPVEIESIQITKSVNSESGKDKKASDTMGTKHRVNHAAYVFYGSINCQLAEKTGFSEEDTEEIKKALQSLFENDTSAARPDGSMAVRKVYWWKHNCKNGQYASAHVHESIEVKPKTEAPYYEVVLHNLEGLKPETYECQ